MLKPHPFLWFDDQAEEAASFYVSLFPDSRITEITRYPKGSPGPEGSVMTVSFVLNGQQVVALNGGPIFALNEAFSFSLICETQEEVDHFWECLALGGQAGPCGWVKDRFGLSWQVNPRILGELLADPDRARSARAFQAMLGMSRIVIADLERAAEGG